MHGSIMAALRSYVTERSGAEAWRAIVAAAGVDSRAYVPTQEYPDAEAIALVRAASSISGIPVNDLLGHFGEYLAPRLLKLYRAFVPPEWNALDLLEHTETTIHRVVRLRNAGADPPRLDCRRQAEDHVVVLYASPRRMCGLGLGLMRGIGAAYGEPLLIQEATCMLNGDGCCTIHVRRGGVGETGTA